MNIKKGDLIEQWYSPDLALWRHQLISPRKGHRSLEDTAYPRCPTGRSTSCQASIRISSATASRPRKWHGRAACWALVGQAVVRCVPRLAVMSLWSQRFIAKLKKDSAGLPSPLVWRSESRAPACARRSGLAPGRRAT
jgi:hypothetical protein